MNYLQTPTTQSYRQFYPQPIARIRPVSSFEEVKASSVDFDGSVFFFPDYINKRIYTKQIGADGAPSYNMYILQDIPTTEPATAEYITREEFNSTLAEIKNALQNINTSQPSSQPKEEQKVEKTPSFNF